MNMLMLTAGPTMGAPMGGPLPPMGMGTPNMGGYAGGMGGVPGMMGGYAPQFN